MLSSLLAIARPARHDQSVWSCKRVRSSVTMLLTKCWWTVVALHAAIGHYTNPASGLWWVTDPFTIPKLVFRSKVWNNYNLLMFWKNQHIIMISEGSCDTEDWSNYAYIWADIGCKGSRYKRNRTVSFSIHRSLRLGQPPRWKTR